jgi:hypothetical protein
MVLSVQVLAVAVRVRQGEILATQTQPMVVQEKQAPLQAQV